MSEKSSLMHSLVRLHETINNNSGICKHSSSKKKSEKKF